MAAAATPPIPTPLLSELRFQPIDEGEVAERLLEVALAEPLGDAPELAGPELLTLAEIAAMWLAAKGRSATLVQLSVATLFSAEPVTNAWSRSVLESYERGLNTPQGARTLGRVRFADWLTRH